MANEQDTNAKSDMTEAELDNVSGGFFYDFIKQAQAQAQAKAILSIAEEVANRPLILPK